jgi:hypothetical protein
MLTPRRSNGRTSGTSTSRLLSRRPNARLRVDGGRWQDPSGRSVMHRLRHDIAPRALCGPRISLLRALLLCRPLSGIDLCRIQWTTGQARPSSPVNHARQKFPAKHRSTFLILSLGHTPVVSFVHRGKTKEGVPPEEFVCLTLAPAESLC